MTILLIIIAVLVLWAIAVFNSLVRMRQRVKEAWADIDVQLKRRYDLIPNLVETVKGYAAHEKDVLEKVVKARSMAMNAHTVKEHGQAEDMLSGALKNLFVLAEAYPNLRASENFAKLQDELSDTENKIQSARRFYNTNVMDLNTKIEQFPANLIVRNFGFNKEQFFEITSVAEREPVKVNF